ncbi:MAG: hypothetical protein ACFHX7_20860 [Pseudomonadota bacterium]
MNWDAIGAAAELLGAIVVLVTLIYLTLQIRLSNKLMMWQYREMNRTTMIDINRDKIVDRELAELIFRAHSGEELDEVDAWRMILQTGNEVIAYQNVFLRAKMMGEQRMIDSAVRNATNHARSNRYFKELLEQGGYDEEFTSLVLQEGGT